MAKTVNARAYRAKPPQSIAFYTYWADVPVGPVGEIYGRPGCAVGACPTNDGLLMTYPAWPIARFEEFRRDVEGSFLRTLDAVGLGERIRAGGRAQRFRGRPDLPSYLRQPHGPGWALVGDAGLLLDPPTSAEMALFRALARRQEDADTFVDVLAGAISLRQFMSPRTMARLVGIGGFARLVLGQARPRRPGAIPSPEPIDYCRVSGPVVG